MKFSPLKYLICIGKALLGFCRYGVFVPHLYGEEKVTPAVIIATDKKFRLADSYTHSDKETVYTNAAYIESHCIFCGKKQVSWYPSFAKYMADDINKIE